MSPESIRLSPSAAPPTDQRRFPAALVALMLLMPIGLFNRYIFADANLPILLLLLVATTLVLTAGRIPKRFFPGITLAFVAFIAYAWSQLDDPLALDFSRRFGAESGMTNIFDIGMYYLMLICVALIWARSGGLARTLWFLICGYILAYMLRNSGDIHALQDGYNLSPGFVVCTLLPFAFLRPGADRPRVIPVLLALFSAFWLALIGARTATGSILIFLAAMYFWPWIARSRMTFFTAFLGLLLVIVAFNVLYLAFATNSAESLVAGSSFGIFEKRLGTRIEIWGHLSYLILQRPWFGYGTDQTTLGVAPLMLMEFTLNRNNLGSHSLYFELLYRLGVVGLAAFVIVLFSIWTSFWAGRETWPVRVAGSFMVGAVVFSTTSEYLVFSAVRLESAFAWIVLGIGVGASLRSRQRERQRNTDGATG
jgi:O-antigen ligase